jgi:hypothetical protein
MDLKNLTLNIIMIQFVITMDMNLKKRVINYLRGDWNPNMTKKTSSGQILEIFFKR